MDLKPADTLDADKLLELYKLYLGTAEKVSDRRAAANTWCLAVNSALIAFYGYLEEGSASVSTLQKSVWHWAIPTAGVFVCLAWAALLSSYGKLNKAKFAVLQELEASFATAPLSREQDIYHSLGRRKLGRIEKRIPQTFIALYAVLFAVATVDFLGLILP